MSPLKKHFNLQSILCLTSPTPRISAILDWRGVHMQNPFRELMDVYLQLSDEVPGTLWQSLSDTYQSQCGREIIDNSTTHFYLGTQSIRQTREGFPINPTRLWTALLEERPTLRQGLATN